MKHYRVIWDGRQFCFGLGKFPDVDTLAEHFDNQPIISGDSGTQHTQIHSLETWGYTKSTMPDRNQVLFRQNKLKKRRRPGNEASKKGFCYSVQLMYTPPKMASWYLLSIFTANCLRHTVQMVGIETIWELHCVAVFSRMGLIYARSFGGKAGSPGRSIQPQNLGNIELSVVFNCNRLSTISSQKYTPF